jgi:serine/threonine kinase 38
MYECLVGYPPFYGDDPLVTCRKILCHRETLVFPREANLSPEAEGLIRSLVNSREERPSGAHEIQAHPFFKGIAWSISSIRHPDVAPFKPTINSKTDTSNFDDFDDRPDDGPRGERCRDTELAFVGYTFRRYQSPDRKGKPSRISADTGQQPRPSLQHQPSRSSS